MLQCIDTFDEPRGHTCTHTHMPINTNTACVHSHTRFYWKSEREKKVSKLTGSCVVLHTGNSCAKEQRKTNNKPNEQKHRYSCGDFDDSFGVCVLVCVCVYMVIVLQFFIQYVMYYLLISRQAIGARCICVGALRACVCVCVVAVWVQSKLFLL